MQKLLLLLSLICFVSCHEDGSLTIQPDPTLGPILEADAKISDYEAVDGCGLSLRISKDSTTTVVYAISDRSKDLIRHYVVYTNSTAELKATVHYQLTNQKKEVMCGWSGNKPFDEVLLLAIKPR